MSEIENKVKTGTCGCGRSPTGECIGWHNLTNEEYKVRLHEWNNSTGKQLLKEHLGLDKA